MTTGYENIRPLTSSVDISSSTEDMILTKAGWVNRQKVDNYGEVLTAFSPERYGRVSSGELSQKQKSTGFTASVQNTVLLTPSMDMVALSDTTPPSLLSWSLSMTNDTSGSIVLTLSEEVNIADFNTSNFSVNIDGKPVALGVGTAAEIIMGSMIRISVGGSTAAAIDAAFTRDASGSVTSVLADISLSASAGWVSDALTTTLAGTTPNLAEAFTDINAAAFTAPDDQLSPTLLSWNLSLTSDAVVLFYSEPVDKSNITITDIEINDYALTGGTIQTPDDGTDVVTITLTETDRLELIRGTSNTADDIFLNLPAAFTNDAFNNTTIEETRFAISGFVPASIDTTAPTLSRWLLNITSDKVAEGQFVFNEFISAFDTDNLTINIEGTDIDIDDTNSVTISGSQVDVIFSEAQAGRLHSALDIAASGVVNTTTANVTLYATEGFATDNAIIPNITAAIETVNAVIPASFQGPADRIAPLLRAWDLNLVSGTISLIFNEVVSKATFAVDNISIGSHTLADTNTFDATNSNNVLITLTSAERDALIISTGNTGSSVSLIATAGLIQDISGNSTAAISAFTSANFTHAVLDTAAPVLANWSLDIVSNTEASATFTFNENIGAFDPSNLNITIAPSTTPINLGSDNIVTGISSSLISVEFGAVAASLFAGVTFDAGGTATTTSSQITLTSSGDYATDISGLPGNALANDTAAIGVANPVFQSPADTTGPALSSWDIDLTTGTLTLALNEIVNKGTISVSDITISGVNRAGTAATHILTNSTIDTAVNSTVIVTLSNTDKDAIVLATNNTSTSTTITLAADYIEDISTNKASAVTARPVTTYTPDGNVDAIKPTLTEWTLTIRDGHTGEATFTLSEEVTSFDASKFSFVVEGDTITIPSISEAATTILGTQVTVIIPSFKVLEIYNALDILPGAVLITGKEDISLTATADWATDGSLLPNNADAITSTVQPVLFTGPTDQTEPTLSSTVLNLGANNPELTLIFNEVINPASFANSGNTIVIKGIDNDSDATTSSISNYTVASSTGDTNTVTILLGSTNRNAIIVNTNNSLADTTISIAAGYGEDISGNIITVPMVDRAPDTFIAATIDTDLPTMVRSILEISSVTDPDGTVTPTAISNLYFNEEVSSADITKLTYTIEGTDIAIDNTNTHTISASRVSITFSPDQAAELDAALEKDAGGTTTTLLGAISVSATEGLITDTSIIPNESAAFTNTALTAFGVPSDTTAPQVSRVNIDLENNLINIVMNEDVDKSSIDLTDITINGIDRSATAATFTFASASTSTINQVTNAFVGIGLSLADKNAIAVATNNTAADTTITLATEWIEDTSSNKAAVSTARSVDYYNPDSTIDALAPTIDSWSLVVRDAGTASMSLVASEAVTDIDLTKFGISIEGAANVVPTAITNGITINGTMVSIELTAVTAAALFTSVDVTTGTGVLNTRAADINLDLAAAWGKDTSVIPNSGILATSIIASDFVGPQDNTNPTIASWDLDLRNEVLYISFNEAVDSTTVNPDNITINTRTLNSTSVASQIGSSSISIALNSADVNPIIIATQNTKAGTTLTATADLVRDIQGNTSEATTSLAVNLFTPAAGVDVTKPRLTTWNASVTSSTSVTLSINVSEVDTTLDLTKFTVIYGTTNGITISGTISTSGGLHTITLDAASSLAIFNAAERSTTTGVTRYRTPNTISLSAAAGWATDNSILPNTADSFTGITPTTLTTPVDNVAPGFQGWSLDLVEGAVYLVYNEAMSIATKNITLITIGGYQLTTFNGFPTSGSSLGLTNNFLKVSFSEADRSALVEAINNGATLPSIEIADLFTRDISGVFTSAVTTSHAASPIASSNAITPVPVQTMFTLGSGVCIPEGAILAGSVRSTIDGSLTSGTFNLSRANKNTIEITPGLRSTQSISVRWSETMSNTTEDIVGGTRTITTVTNAGFSVGSTPRSNFNIRVQTGDTIVARDGTGTIIDPSRYTVGTNEIIFTPAIVNDTVTFEITQTPNITTTAIFLDGTNLGITVGSFIQTSAGDTIDSGDNRQEIASVDITNGQTELTFVNNTNEAYAPYTIPGITVHFGDYTPPSVERTTYQELDIIRSMAPENLSNPVEYTLGFTDGSEVVTTVDNSGILATQIAASTLSLNTAFSPITSSTDINGAEVLRLTVVATGSGTSEFQFPEGWFFQDANDNPTFRFYYNNIDYGSHHISGRNTIDLYARSVFSPTSSIAANRLGAARLAELLESVYSPYDETGTIDEIRDTNRALGRNCYIVYEPNIDNGNVIYIIRQPNTAAASVSSLPITNGGTSVLSIVRSNVTAIPGLAGQTSVLPVKGLTIPGITQFTSATPTTTNGNLLVSRVDFNGQTTLRFNPYGDTARPLDPTQIIRFGDFNPSGELQPSRVATTFMDAINASSNPVAATLTGGSSLDLQKVDPMSTVPFAYLNNISSTFVTSDVTQPTIGAPSITAAMRLAGSRQIFGLNGAFQGFAFRNSDKNFFELALGGTIFARNQGHANPLSHRVPNTRTGILEGNRFTGTEIWQPKVGPLPAPFEGDDKAMDSTASGASVSLRFLSPNGYAIVITGTLRSGINEVNGTPNYIRRTGNRSFTPMYQSGGTLVAAASFVSNFVYSFADSILFETVDRVQFYRDFSNGVIDPRFGSIEGPFTNVDQFRVPFRNRLRSNGVDHNTRWCGTNTNSPYFQNYDIFFATTSNDTKFNTRYAKGSRWTLDMIWEAEDTYINDFTYSNVTGDITVPQIPNSLLPAPGPATRVELPPRTLDSGNVIIPAMDAQAMRIQNSESRPGDVSPRVYFEAEIGQRVVEVNDAADFAVNTRTISR